MLFVHFDEGCNIDGFSNVKTLATLVHFLLPILFPISVIYLYVESIVTVRKILLFPKLFRKTSTIIKFIYDLLLGKRLLFIAQVCMSAASNWNMSAFFQLGRIKSCTVTRSNLSFPFAFFSLALFKSAKVFHFFFLSANISSQGKRPNHLE